MKIVKYSQLTPLVHTTTGGEEEYVVSLAPSQSVLDHLEDGVGVGGDVLITRLEPAETMHSTCWPRD